MLTKDRVKQREANKKSYQKHKSKRKEYYLEHKEHTLEGMKRRSKEYHLRLRIEVLSYYSNSEEPKCLMCGEKRLPCLSIDHIKGDGAEERRRLGIAGVTFYRWLKKQNYPEGYQTLCMNCQ